MDKDVTIRVIELCTRDTLNRLDEIVKPIPDGKNLPEYKQAVEKIKKCSQSVLNYIENDKHR